jgi:hypothetical protein
VNNGHGEQHEPRSHSIHIVTVEMRLNVLTRTLTPADGVVKFECNTMNQAHNLSTKEWQEIMQVSEVRESWGLDGHETPEEFAELAYGARFDFASGGPGYVGDLYIVCGDALGEPLTLIRRGNALVVV